MGESPFFVRPNEIASDCGRGVDWLIDGVIHRGGTRKGLR